MAEKTRRNIYKEVTDSILESLENGVVPWVKNWKTDNIFVPHNATSGKSYNGINFTILSLKQVQSNFESSQWLTFKQAADLKGTIIKGSKGSHAVFFNWMAMHDGKTLKKDEEKALVDTGLEKNISRVPYLTSFVVFNKDQIEGLSEKKGELNEIESNRKSLSELSVVDLTKKLIADNKISFIPSTDGKLSYDIKKDEIRLPNHSTFADIDDYCRSAIQGMVLATAHESKMNRGVTNKNVSYSDADKKAIEALIVDLASSQIHAKLGIDGVFDKSEYLDQWLKLLKADERLFFTVSSQAQKAANLLLSAEASPDLSKDAFDDDDFSPGM